MFHAVAQQVLGYPRIPLGIAGGEGAERFLNAVTHIRGNHRAHAIVHHLAGCTHQLHSHGPPGQLRMRDYVQIAAGDYRPDGVGVGCRIVQHTDFKERPSHIQHYTGKKGAQ